MEENKDLQSMNPDEGQNPATENDIPDELKAMADAEGGADAGDTGKKKGKKAKEPKAPKEKKVKEPKEPKAPRDNIGRINGMTSINDVRKALQVAIAKKAKASDKPETVARYELEISTAKEKLAALVDSAKTVEDLINLGEEPNRIITAHILAKENAFAEFEKDHKVSKKLLKSITDDIPESFYTELPMSLHDALNARFGKSDYRLKAACRVTNLMEAVTAGNITYTDGKWFDAEGKQIGREPKASDTATTDAATAEGTGDNGSAE